MFDERAIDIFIVEDSDFMRFCLRTLIRKVPGFNVVGEAADGTTAVQRVLELKPSLALVDIGLPDIDGIEVTRQIKEALPEVRVLILTASDECQNIFASLDAGADGYVLKGNYSLKLESAIRSARIGKVWLDPGLAQEVLAAASKLRGPGVYSVHGNLSDEERILLGQVAGSNCRDGVCLVDPAFLKKLRRFSAMRQAQTGEQAPIMDEEFAQT